MDEDRLLQPVASLQQRQILVDEGDVPGALDLRQHDDVELVADLADEPRHVVEEPRRVERVDTRPQAGRAEVGRARHGDEALARRRLRFDRDRVLEVAEHDVDLRGQLADLGAQLVDVRRHEMDHALDARGRFAQRLRRADRQGFVKLARNSHRRIAMSSGRRIDRANRRPRQLRRPPPTVRLWSALAQPPGATETLGADHGPERMIVSRAASDEGAP